MSWMRHLTAVRSRPKYEAAVVIPVYRSEMTPYEQVAFERCLEIFHAHSIILAAPDGLNLEAYLTPSEGLGLKRFSSRFFQNIGGYNKLMLSQRFYESFLDYEFVLVYQLDAFVFRDELSKWCLLDFDYVGAPWVGANVPDVWSLSGMPFWARIHKLRQRVGIRDTTVGNGGFSLRRVRSFLRVLLFLPSAASQWGLNEDRFWSMAAPGCVPGFRIPRAELALEFSFELAPRDCFRRNGNRLPFGCHAWWTHDLEFWRPIFRQYGYKV